MRRHLAIAALAAGLLAFATSARAEEAPVIELAAPRAAAGSESVELAVTTGALPRGARLALSTENGEILGAVAPYAPAAARRGSTPRAHASQRMIPPAAYRLAESATAESQPFRCALISLNLDKARSNLSLNSHIASRISP